LVNALFGQYGLVIVDADDSPLKKTIRCLLLTRDIIEQNSFKNILPKPIRLLQSIGVHIQVNPREINFLLSERPPARTDGTFEARPLLPY
jgi:uncharacterized protein YllA (UPF0747 family)